MVSFCKYSDASMTEGSDDTDHVTTTTTAVTTCHDDEFVCDSLSETEHSPFNNNHAFYSRFFQHTYTKEKFPLFTIPNNGLNDNYMLDDEDSQTLNIQSRNKFPLKAVDLDSSNSNHYLQANDRSMVRNNTPDKVISGHASREQMMRCDYNHPNIPADTTNHNRI